MATASESRRGLTIIAADERVLVVRFLAFGSRLRRANIICVLIVDRSQLNWGVSRRADPRESRRRAHS